MRKPELAPERQTGQNLLAPIFVKRERSKGGRVTLVGAGPGAADLLTLRALKALQTADVILFDDLVSNEVLELARREAKKFTVGKRGGRASCRQDDINTMMVRFARQGKHVVRLKSGDPMIFGRGGEEMEQLRAAGISFDVVPGITAANAAAATTKTSLTHRDCAQGVKFITAHSRHGELPDLDWRACADSATTLMIYMGARTAPALARKLLTHGMAANTPAVIMTALSRPEERIETTTLAALQQHPIASEHPVLLGIGATFALASSSNSINSIYYKEVKTAIEANA